MTEQAVKTDKKEKIIAMAGHWDVPLSAVKKMEEQQKEVRTRAEFMRLHCKEISDVLRKW